MIMVGLLVVAVVAMVTAVVVPAIVALAAVVVAAVAAVVSVHHQVCIHHVASLWAWTAVMHWHRLVTTHHVVNLIGSPYNCPWCSHALRREKSESQHQIKPCRGITSNCKVKITEIVVCFYFRWLWHKHWLGVKSQSQTSLGFMHVCHAFILLNFCPGFKLWLAMIKLLSPQLTCMYGNKEFCDLICLECVFRIWEYRAAWKLLELEINYIHTSKNIEVYIPMHTTNCRINKSRSALQKFTD